ncbi:MAG: glutaredoxin 3 [Pseudomonadota bacterium]
MSKNQASISLYITQTCPFCVRAKNLLNSKQVSFTEIDIGQEPERYSEMVGKSGGVTSVPQIFIGNFHVGGCDDLYALEAAAGLNKLLFP